MGQAPIEEVSYNFSRTGSYVADNDWTDGLNNAGFPQPAIYISESGSDAAPLVVTAQHSHIR